MLVVVVLKFERALPPVFTLTIRSNFDLMFLNGYRLILSDVNSAAMSYAVGVIKCSSEEETFSRGVTSLVDERLN